MANFLFKQWKKLLSLVFKSSNDPYITEKELLTIGARVVYPECDMALRLGRQLVSNQYLDYFMLDNDMEISQIKATEKVIGKSVVDLSLRQKFGVTMIAVEHENQTDTEIAPDYRFRMGDVLIVIGKREKTGAFEAFIGNGG